MANHANVALNGDAILGFCARKRNAAGRGTHEKRCRFQEGRLAGTIVAEQRDAVAGRNLQRNLAESGERAVPFFDSIEGNAE